MKRDEGKYHLSHIYDELLLNGNSLKTKQNKITKKQKQKNKNENCQLQDIH